MIEVSGITKSYRIGESSVHALRGVNLTIRQGEFVAIMGASGSGKSTLMHILGLLDVPDSGTYRLMGKEIGKLTDDELATLRNNVAGFVFQQFHLLGRMSAIDNVMLPGIYSDRQADFRADALARLETVGLAHRADQRPSQMSGGEQQRVAIAVALANDPKLLLADEPTGEVDSATALAIYDTFKRLNREYGLTTLIVSHDPGIARHVNRVVAIQDGKMATETVRQSMSTGESEGELEEEEDIFHELVVLDSAGRLRVPKEYLEQFGIKGRVMLDLVEEGILISPVPESVQAQASEQYVSEMVSEAEGQKWRGLKALALLRSAGQRVTDLASRLRAKKGRR